MVESLPIKKCCMFFSYFAEVSGGFDSFFTSKFLGLFSVCVTCRD